MVHFIFSVVVVLLWLVAWGIYLVFGKSLKIEMEGIENSDPNQNNPFITAAMGIGGAAISIFFPDTKPHCLHRCCSNDRRVSHLEFQWVVFLESNGLFSSLCVFLLRFNISKYT